MSDDLFFLRVQEAFEKVKDEEEDVSVKEFLETLKFLIQKTYRVGYEKALKDTTKILKTFEEKEEGFR
ncbi:MAG: hypothetical protein ACPLTR_10410 [Thermacetogeniaceae bacterium]